MKKNLRMVSILLTVVLLMGTFVTPVASGQGNGRVNGRGVSVEPSPQQIAEAYRIMEETEQFFANLTPETLWETYLRENPEVVRMSANELSEIRREVKALYETIAVNNATPSPNSISANNISANYNLGGNHIPYTRHFSAMDGVSITNRTALEADGATATAAAILAFPDGAKRDAYRHYLWNYLGVRNNVISLNPAIRLRSTRVYTTNFELVANIFRHRPDLNVAEPSAEQRATALNLRNAMFNRSFAQWDDLWWHQYPCGRIGPGSDDLMDLVE